MRTSDVESFIFRFARRFPRTAGKEQVNPQAILDRCLTGKYLLAYYLGKSLLA
jgi:hypothetical protein